jgi:hypothetical protein
MKRVFMLALIQLSPILSFGQSSGHDVTSCRTFAVDFFAWYVPFTQRELNEPAFYTAIRHKQSAFAPALLLALKTDAKAQSKVEGEIVGIDFDPFVGGQDPADHYDVRNIKLKGNHCFAEIWRKSSNETSAKLPDSIAELSQVKGAWQFVNFHYPGVKGNLVSVLASWRKDRRGK